MYSCVMLARAVGCGGGWQEKVPWDFQTKMKVGLLMRKNTKRLKISLSKI